MGKNQKSNKTNNHKVSGDSKAKTVISKKDNFNGQRSSSGKGKNIIDVDALNGKINDQVNGASVTKQRPVISNNPEWYTNIQVLADNVASLVFNEPSGTQKAISSDTINNCQSDQATLKHVCLEGSQVMSHQ